MNKNDKRDFYELMAKSFADYGKTVSIEMMEEWFEDLWDYTFFQVRGAFRAYKLENVYVPVVAAIRKYAIKVSRESAANILRCVNLIDDNQCGKEIFVSGYCEKCYDAHRPKSFVDLKREEYLKKYYETAKISGIKKGHEMIEYSKKEIGLSRFGKILLTRLGENGSDSASSKNLMSAGEFLKNYNPLDCEGHNKPGNFKQISEIC